MADFLRFNNDQEMFELRDAGHLSGSLMHLATLEVEQNTYLALGSIQENELGLMAGIVVVRQMEDELAKKMTIDRDAFVMDYTDYKEFET